MFASAQRLPYLYGYEGAKKRFDQIKPLRNGARMGRKPLGARKDTHMFIQENNEGDLECVLYATAVVTFKKDNGVVVTPGKWPSSLTCAFIEGLLGDVTINRTRGLLVIKTSEGKHPLKDGMSIELERVPAEPGRASRWKVCNAEGVRVWAPNRAKANSVRAKYKEMIGYHKGIVSLLTQERDKNNEDDPFEAARIILLPKDVLADALGTSTRIDRNYVGISNGQYTEVETAYIDVQMFVAVIKKPTWLGYYGGDTDEAKREADERAHKRKADWFAERDKVLDLMRSDQPEETKHANFLKAAMGLMCAASGVRAFTFDMKGRGSLVPIELSYSAAADAVTQFLTLAYAEEIMELKQMPVGRVPTTSHADILFDEFRNKGEGK